MTTPVNLDLRTIRFPITAVISFLHRVSGVVIALGLAYLLYMLSLALSSEQGFEDARQMFSTPMHAVTLWVILSALGYHVVAGIRHLLMDIHLGDELAGARRASWLVLIVSVVLSILCAAKLWF